MLYANTFNQEIISPDMLWSVELENGRLITLGKIMVKAWWEKLQ